MKRISKINISNYRAFYNERDELSKYQINLSSGENLLIYGENGSGKSSFFKAIKELFSSAKNAELTIQGNIFISGGLDLPPTQVSLGVSERKSESGPLTLVEEILFNDESPSTHGNPMLLNAAAYFLSYKDLLRTYYINNDYDQEKPDLFEILIINLLGNQTDSSTFETFKESLENIDNRIITIEIALTEALSNHLGTEAEKIQETERIREDLISQIRTEVISLNYSITEILESSLQLVNKYLSSFFSAKIEVSISNRDQYLDLIGQQGEYKLEKHLYLDVAFFDRNIDITAYQTFLNEARLSALAICFYLSAAKITETSEDNLKVIFLDDIFIGLDTSNRIPLLKILKSDFTEFQLFITTYDRQWYELAKGVLSDWKCVELYVGNKVGTKIEFPVMISKDLELKEKARRLIDTYDYLSAGNVIRKALEKQIEILVPKIYLVTETDLEGYFRQLTQFFSDSGCIDQISHQLQQDLYTFKDIVLNPTSHYDLRSPIYKGELETAYNLLEAVCNLPLLKRTPLLNIGDCLFYNHTSRNYKAQYILTETIYSVVSSTGIRRITDPNHKIVYWDLQNLPYSNKQVIKYDDATISLIQSQLWKLSQRPSRIQNFLSLETLPNWQTEFKDSRGLSLLDLQTMKTP